MTGRARQLGGVLFLAFLVPTWGRGADGREGEIHPLWQIGQEDQGAAEFAPAPAGNCPISLQRFGNVDHGLLCRPLRSADRLAVRLAWAAGPLGRQPRQRTNAMGPDEHASDRVRPGPNGPRPAVRANSTINVRDSSPLNPAAPPGHGQRRDLRTRLSASGGSEASLRGEFWPGPSRKPCGLIFPHRCCVPVTTKSRCAAPAAVGWFSDAAPPRCAPAGARLAPRRRRQ